MECNRTELEGKEQVITNCKQTTEYFNLVETNFKTDDIIVVRNKVVVRGTGEFIRDGKRVNFIKVCDVYEFNDEDKLEKISSYCISEKN